METGGVSDENISRGSEQDFLRSDVQCLVFCVVEEMFLFV